MDGISMVAMIPSPKSSRFWYSVSDLNPKSPSMVPSLPDVSPMTCGVAASLRLYSRAAATMRAYFSAEWSSFAARADDSAALRAAPACSTPSQANVPTPARQNTTVTAMSARNTRLACRARMRRRRRMRRPSEARSPSMIQSQSITSIPLPRSVPRISTGMGNGKGPRPDHSAHVRMELVDGRPPALPSPGSGHSSSGMPWPFMRLVSMTVEPMPNMSSRTPPAMAIGRPIPPVSTKFS